jgi:hypothetical protein
MSEREADPFPRADEPDAVEELVLWWRNPDGSVDRGHPLRRANAEEMARIFSRMYPEQTYWLEPLMIVPRGAYAGVRRKRPRPDPGP